MKHAYRSALAVLVAIAVIACAPRPEDLPTNAGQDQSAGQPLAPANPDPPPVAATGRSGRSLCGLQLGEPIPADMETHKVEVATDGDPVTIYQVKACGDATTLSIELESGKISRLDLEGAGACVPDIACVGETYAEVIARFPSARRLASLIDGRRLALIIDDRTGVRFDAAGLEDDCFDQPRTKPNKCEALFLERRVTSIGLT